MGLKLADGFRSQFTIIWLRTRGSLLQGPCLSQVLRKPKQRKKPVQGMEFSIYTPHSSFGLRRGHYTWKNKTCKNKYALIMLTEHLQTRLGHKKPHALHSGLALWINRARVISKFACTGYAAPQLHDETPSQCQCDPNLSWQPTTSGLALQIR